MLKKILLAAVAIVAIGSTSAYAAPLSDTEFTQITGFVDKQSPSIEKNALAIWKLAEPGYMENESSTLLKKTLTSAGFKVTSGVADIPTAFVASYKNGDGPVIALLAEYDALLGLTQQQGKTSPAPDDSHIAGHACGHNLLGAGSVGAAIAVKDWMKANNIKGEIRLYGTPAEEGGDGKAYMVRAGLFNDVDAVIHWHPGDGNSVSNNSSLANIKTDFTFHGVSSHAAAAPQLGRSALAGVEVMDVAVNYMRQFIPQETRIHSSITNGGKAPNVIPALAKSSYYVRNPDVNVLQGVQARLLKAADGAAIATETKVDYEVMGGVYPLLINQTLNKIAYGNLEKTAPSLKWTPEETKYAQEIQASAGTTKLGVNPQEVEPLVGNGKTYGYASTDVGDVSYVVPTVGLGTATWPKGIPPHSWGSTAASGNSIGVKGAVLAARAMSLTAAELMQSPDVLAQARTELKGYQGEGFKYKSLFGDRKPPLNYINKLMGK